MKVVAEEPRSNAIRLELESPACQEDQPVSPFFDDIRLAAYYSWKRKGERHGFDQEDWFNSESDLSIKANYSPAVFHWMGTDETVFIGNREHRRCRYCDRSSPEVTFRKKAHALPEFPRETRW